MIFLSLCIVHTQAVGDHTSNCQSEIRTLLKCDSVRRPIIGLSLRLFFSFGKIHSLWTDLRRQP
jgi:hypothetical protein